MLEYILAVKRQLRDGYGFVPGPRSSPDEPVFAEGTVPDGEYPMTINGRLDKVSIEGGAINCCNF